MIKSRPIYAPFHIDPTGRAHLVVTEFAALPEDIDLTFSNIEVWTVSTIAPGIQAPATAQSRAYRAVADLFSHLRHRLTRDTIGLRLYAVGSEGFLWDVHNIATGAGLNKAEIFLTQSGSLKRRVYCSHCKTMNEDITTSICPCTGCGARLFVRDHFSRRLAAFMGVAVDAEVPGEVPEAEVLYP
jgi:hypothetical protein